MSDALSSALSATRTPRFAALLLRIAALFALALLSLPAATAFAAPSFSIAFGELDVSTLSPWDAGRMRLMIWLQADSCVRQAHRSKKAAPEGELALSLAVSPAGKAPQAKVTGSTPAMRKAATCLQRALRSKITFPTEPAAYTWKSKLHVGEIPDGISVSILRIDTEYLGNRSIFESVFTTQLERASCLATTLEPGMSVALNADLELAPGKATAAKVTLSTHAADSVLTCLEPQLAAIVPPADSIPAKVHVFFHLLQPALEPAEGDNIPTLEMAPSKP